MKSTPDPTSPAQASSPAVNVNVTVTTGSAGAPPQPTSPWLTLRIVTYVVVGLLATGFLVGCAMVGGHLYIVLP